MIREAARYFRAELRSARAAALSDAEAYAKPLHTLERLGRFQDRRAWNLKKAEGALNSLAQVSPYYEDLPARWPHLHRRFPAVYHTLREMRNDVMHVGAHARHLTTYAVEACLTLEDAISTYLQTVGDLMVADPVVVERWHPVSLARQKLLEYSFSFLPFGLRRQTVSGGSSPITRLLASSESELGAWNASPPRSRRRSDTPGWKRTRPSGSIIRNRFPGRATC